MISYTGSGCNIEETSLAASFSSISYNVSSSSVYSRGISRASSSSIISFYPSFSLNSIRDLLCSISKLFVSSLPSSLSLRVKSTRIFPSPIDCLNFETPFASLILPLSCDNLIYSNFFGSKGYFSVGIICFVMNDCVIFEVTESENRPWPWP